MKHKMKLLSGPFEKIINGKKKIELRLFDEKRGKLNVGDVIEFSKLPDLEEKIEVEVIALLRYSSFKDLLVDFGFEFFGYPYDYDLDEFLRGCYEIYSKEKEAEFGVLGIKIKKI